MFSQFLYFAVRGITSLILKGVNTWFITQPHRFLLKQIFLLYAWKPATYSFDLHVCLLRISKKWFFFSSYYNQKSQTEKLNYAITYYIVLTIFAPPQMNTLMLDPPWKQPHQSNSENYSIKIDYDLLSYCYLNSIIILYNICKSSIRFCSSHHVKS